MVGFEFGNIENVVEDRHQRIAGFFDGIRVIGRSRDRSPSSMSPTMLRKPFIGANFMAHRRQKLRFKPAGRAGFLGQLFQPFDRQFGI